MKTQQEIFDYAKGIYEGAGQKIEFGAADAMADWAQYTAEGGVERLEELDEEINALLDQDLANDEDVADDKARDYLAAARVREIEDAALAAACEDFKAWKEGFANPDVAPASWEEAAAKEIALDRRQGYPEATVFGGPYEDEEMDVYRAAYAREFCHRGYDADKARDERKARAAQ